MNLYNLENKILRKHYKDPRIHFAINCASASCPYLPKRLFQAGNLEDYLEELTLAFINNPDYVSYDPTTKILRISMIFKWYRKDFQDDGGIKSFMQKYLKNAPDDFNQYEIQFFNYNWKLNKQKGLETKLIVDI